MHPKSSSAPSPGVPQPQITPQPGPTVVPQRETPPPRRKGLWTALIALALVGGGLAYYLNQQNEAAKLAAKGGGGIIAVSTAVVGMGDLNATVRVNGTITAQNFAALLAPRIQGSRSGMNRGGDGGGRGGGGGGGSAPMGGGDATAMMMMMGGPTDFTLVLLKLANPGIRIKTGDTVAEFDPTNQLQRLDDYKDSAVQQENTVKKMLANLAAVKEAHDQQVRTAKSDWDKALLDLKTKEVRSEIDAEKFRLTAEENEAKYKQLVAESALVDESQRASIRSSELNRDQSKLEMGRAEANVAKMVIKAPMDGIVVLNTTTRNGEFGQIREGDVVAAGQPFMTIVDPSSMVLNATVNQVDAEKLRLGMKATIRIDAYPDLELPGTLIGIGALAKASTFRARFVGEIPIRLKIDKMDTRVIPDLTGSAEIVLNSERNTMLVPRSAVFAENNESYVFVQGPEGWLKKKVEVGTPNYTNVAIKGGIQKGDVVALQRPL
ncbi:MAG TPA: HlyD family efflux transporter periplasmic adaptor subunit [Candidatus Acidoferrum sp.]|nr:HlyD family efflux transporter periplasmic adaptor subunit [Candidatus Acidoferrum sp.]